MLENENDAWCRFPVVLFLTELFVYQATAEQIRLAQMIYDKNDADFEDKVKQVVCLCITHTDILLAHHRINLDFYDNGTLTASGAGLTCCWSFVLHS